MSRARLLELATVTALLATVIGLRFVGLDWDEGGQPHPDERFLSMVADHIELPGSIGEYLDTGSSPSNPTLRGHGFFVYGTFPILVTKIVAEAVGQDSYWELYLVGRTLSAGLDVLTVLLAFVLARRLHSRAAGLVAVLLVGCAVIHVQHAHFFVVDPWLACFATATVAALTVFAAGGSRLSAPVAAATFGLAVACKVSALPLLAPAAAAFLLRRLRGERLATVLVDAGVFAAVAAVVVRIAYPYAFAPGALLAPNPVLLSSLADLRRAATNLAFPPAVQWHGVLPGYALVETVIWGTGLLAGLAGLVGLGLATVRVVRGRWPQAFPALVWAVVGILFTALQPVQPMRYLLPVTPVLLTFGAVLLVELGWAAERRSGGVRGRTLGWVPLGLTCAASLIWAAAFAKIYERPHVRAEATRWIAGHVPADDVIAIEHWDEPVPGTVEKAQPATRATSWMPVFDSESPAKISVMVAVLQSSDWLVLASQRGYGAIARAPERYPATLRYYRALLREELGYELAASFTDFPALGGLEIDTSEADESFSVYDHPRVLIFRKTGAFDPQRARALLDGVAGDPGIPTRAELFALIRTLEKKLREPSRLAAEET